jgi:hypothetical protein
MTLGGTARIPGAWEPTSSTRCGRRTTSPRLTARTQRGHSGRRQSACAGSCSGQPSADGAAEVDRDLPVLRAREWLDERQPAPGIVGVDGIPTTTAAAGWAPHTDGLWSLKLTVRAEPNEATLPLERCHPSATGSGTEVCARAGMGASRVRYAWPAVVRRGILELNDVPALLLAGCVLGEGRCAHGRKHRGRPHRSRDDGAPLQDLPSVDPGWIQLARVVIHRSAPLIGSERPPQAKQAERSEHPPLSVSFLRSVRPGNVLEAAKETMMAEVYPAGGREGYISGPHSEPVSVPRPSEFSEPQPAWGLRLVSEAHRGAPRPHGRGVGAPRRPRA